MKIEVQKWQPFQSRDPISVEAKGEPKMYQQPRGPDDLIPAKQPATTEQQQPQSAQQTAPTETIGPANSTYPPQDTPETWRKLMTEFAPNLTFLDEQFTDGHHNVLQWYTAYRKQHPSRRKEMYLYDVARQIPHQWAELACYLWVIHEEARAGRVGPTVFANHTYREVQQVLKKLREFQQNIQSYLELTKDWMAAAKTEIKDTPTTEGNQS